MTYPNKEQFCQIVNSIINENEHRDRVNEAFAKLDCENQIMSLRSYEQSLADDLLMQLAFGKAGFNTVNWWIYDTINYTTSERNAIWYDDSGHPQQIKTVEELYEYCKERDFE